MRKSAMEVLRHTSTRPFAVKYKVYATPNPCTTEEMYHKTLFLFDAFRVGSYSRGGLIGGGLIELFYICHVKAHCQSSFSP